ncbi:MAG: thiamine diphosphokinase [Actinomycetota bacterium]
MPGVTLIVAGGARPDPLVVAALPEVDRCIAADSGGDLALAIGLQVDLLVGDLDSVSPDGLDRIRASGADLQEHPRDKDRTDLELAVDAAVDGRPDRIVIIGLAGGRIDHALANIGVLAAAARPGIDVEGLLGSARLAVVDGKRTLTGALGETLSLLPILGTVDGVTTAGLEFPLDDEPLPAGSARGMSNRFVANEATVEVRSGVLLAVQPFALRERRRT